MLFVSVAFQKKSAGQMPAYLALPYDRHDWTWAGFQETIQWIQQNVPASEIVASQFDPLYYLYTGRQGIRFWFHNQRSYFYPDVTSSTPFVGDAPTVVPMLKQMNVRWLIREPAAGCCFAEWQGVDRLAESISAEWLSEGGAGLRERGQGALGLSAGVVGLGGLTAI